MFISQSDQRLLLDVHFLADLPDDVLLQLTQDAFVQALPKGATLFEQGGTAQFLHAILAGRAAITSAIGDRETIISIREGGEVILDSATILAVPYTVGCRMIESGRVMMIPASKFRELTFNDPATGSAALRAVAGAGLALTEHIRELKLLTTIQRLARHLLSLTAAATGSATVTLRDDRPVLAALLGMTPESLSRAFAHLRTIGVHADKRGAVTIEDVRDLRALSKLDDQGVN